MSEMINAEHHKSVAGHVATEDIKFGYCTEIMVALKTRSNLCQRL